MENHITSRFTGGSHHSISDTGHLKPDLPGFAFEVKTKKHEKATGSIRTPDGVWNSSRDPQLVQSKAASRCMRAIYQVLERASNSFTSRRSPPNESAVTVWCSVQN